MSERSDESRLEPRMVEGTPRVDAIVDALVDGDDPTPLFDLARQLEREVEYWRARCVMSERPRDGR